MKSLIKNIFSFLKAYSIKNYNFRLIFFALVLSIMGILLIGSADNSYQNKQILGLVIGLVVMVAVSLMDYNVLLKYSWGFYIVNIILLLLVRLVGSDAGGATRWISIAGIILGPFTSFER